MFQFDVLELLGRILLMGNYRFSQTRNHIRTMFQFHVLELLGRILLMGNYR